MKKLHSVLFGCCVAFLCCFLSVNAHAWGWELINPVNWGKAAYEYVIEPAVDFAVDSYKFVTSSIGAHCFSDCDQISQSDINKLVNAYTSDDMNTFTNGGSGYKGWQYYAENSHCTTCLNNATAIEMAVHNAVKDACAAQYCNGDLESDCFTEKCAAEASEILKKGMEENEKTRTRLQEFEENANRFMKDLDWLCTVASATAVGVAAAAILPVGAMMATAIIGSSAVAGLIKANSGGATFPAILNAFLNVGGTGCWFCSIFDTVYNAGNTLATNLYEKLQNFALIFLAFGGVFWILFVVLRFLTTLHGPNVGELLTTLFKGLLTIMMVGIFLQAPSDAITGYIVDVPAGFALKLSNDILGASGFTNGNTITYQTNSSGLSNCPLADRIEIEKVQSQSKTVQLCEASDAGNYDGMVLSATLHDDLSCLLKRVSAEMIVGMAIGATFVTESVTAWYGLPNFAMMLAGILVFLSYFALFIIVPFKLIDLILRFCFVIILLPVFVACFAFRATRGYTKRAWDLFLSTWITLIALCVFITFAITIMSAIFTKSGG